MCGFAGFWGTGNRQILHHMAIQIQHRGPDHQGVFFDPQTHVGLAFRRLAILDLRPEGNQPMKHPELDIWIVFNGEIYNYVELAKEYLKRERLKTQTDTEVLLRMYARYGTDAFALFNGMFAFAIYDRRQSPKLILARDRMGKKPLYYGVFGNTLLFASEIKALTVHPAFRRVLNPLALTLYLLMDCVPTPLSIYANLAKLEQGSWIQFTSPLQNTAPRRFYEFSFSKLRVTKQEALAQLDALLQDSVRIRLRSDVPVGVFLSGGIDSSTIAWYVAQHTTQVSAFCIGFEDPSYDESEYAIDVARHVGIPYEMEVFSPPRAQSMIEEVLPLVDEPFADSSLLPTYYLCKLARKHIIVALGGDGGDELMGSYPTFQVLAWVRLFRLYWLPQWLWQFAQSLIPWFLPYSDANMSLHFKARKFVRGMQIPHPYHHAGWIGSWLPHEQILQWNGATNRNWLGQAISFLRKRIPVNNRLPWQDWIHLYYYRTYLLDDILVKVDRASMYNSLEVRAPFLDFRIVNLLNRLPTPWKWNLWKGKLILRQLMQPRLPQHVFTRKKKGFGIPIAAWLRHPFREPLLQAVHRLKSAGILREQPVLHAIHRHMSRKEDHRNQLWNLLVLGEWVKHYGFTDIAQENSLPTQPA